MGEVRKYDAYGNLFKYSSYVLSKKEYAKIISEINSSYDLYVGKRMAIHYSLGVDNVYYAYTFENHGFNDYNIVTKFRC